MEQAARELHGSDIRTQNEENNNIKYHWSTESNENSRPETTENVFYLGLKITIGNSNVTKSTHSCWQLTEPMNQDDWFRRLYNEEYFNQNHDRLVLGKIRPNSIRWARNLIRMNESARKV